MGHGLHRSALSRDYCLPRIRWGRLDFSEVRIAGQNGFVTLGKARLTTHAAGMGETKAKSSAAGGAANE